MMHIWTFFVSLRVLRRRYVHFIALGDSRIVPSFSIPATSQPPLGSFLRVPTTSEIARLAFSSCLLGDRKVSILDFWVDKKGAVTEVIGEFLVPELK